MSKSKNLWYCRKLITNFLVYLPNCDNLSSNQNYVEYKC